MRRQSPTGVLSVLLLFASAAPASANDRCLGQWNGEIINTTVQVRTTMSIAFDSSGEGGVLVIATTLYGSSRFSLATGRRNILVLRTHEANIEWQILECDVAKGVLRGRYTVLGHSQKGEFQLKPVAAFTPKL